MIETILITGATLYASFLAAEYSMGKALGRAQEREYKEFLKKYGKDVLLENLYEYLYNKFDKDDYEYHESHLSHVTGDDEIRIRINFKKYNKVFCKSIQIEDDITFEDIKKELKKLK